MLQQILLDLLHVGGGKIDLVDGHDHRHAGVAGVADGLDRLRHDLVVGRHHQHHDVGNLRAAGPHGGEGLVTRGIEEGDLLPARQLDVIGADVLGDTAGFARDDVRLADVVEQ